jgi:hypothetical protein
MRWITGSQEARVDVAGISAVPQRLKPSLYCLEINPSWESQALGLPQSGIETVCAEGSTASHAADRDSAQYSCEFEGECLKWPRESCECLGLETFDVDFDKSRLAMTFDELVQGDCRSDKPVGPALTTPSRERLSFAGAHYQYPDVPIELHPLPLCCTDQQPGAVSPPQRHLREANVLRPAKLEHAVQQGGSNGHLGRLPASGP